MYKRQAVGMIKEVGLDGNPRADDRRVISAEDMLRLERSKEGDNGVWAVGCMTGFRVLDADAFLDAYAKLFGLTRDVVANESVGRLGFTLADWKNITEGLSSQRPSTFGFEPAGATVGKHNTWVDALGGKRAVRACRLKVGGRREREAANAQTYAAAAAAAAPQ